MEFELKMPDLATTKAEVEVKTWLVEVGQPLRRGQPLLEVETDKTVMEVESVVTGILKAVYTQPGDEIAAGQVIAIIEVEDSADVGKDSKPAEDSTHSTIVSQNQKEPAITTEPALTQPAMQASDAPRKGKAGKAGSMFARNRRLNFKVKR